MRQDGRLLSRPARFILGSDNNLKAAAREGSAAELRGGAGRQRQKGLR